MYFTVIYNVVFSRYLSDGELLDSTGGSISNPGVVGIPVTSGIDSNTSPPRTYYVWKDPPPQSHMTGYEMSYPVVTDAPGPGGANSPIRHSSYASQVGYYLQQQQPPQLQSGGPRTTPSGYPGETFLKVIYLFTLLLNSEKEQQLVMDRGYPKSDFIRMILGISQIMGLRNMAFLHLFLQIFWHI